MSFALAATILAGCPTSTGLGPDKPLPPPGDGETTVEVDVGSGELPTQAGSAVSLGEPPAPDPSKVGLAYLKKMSPKIGAAWTGFLVDCQTRLPPDHPLNQSTLEATVELEVNAKGALVGSKLATKSGSTDFDKVALEVVRDAGPFPKPPVDLISDDDRFHVSWLFARDNRQAGLATADVRVIRWAPDKIVPKLLARGDVTNAALRIREAARGPVPSPSLVPLLDKVAGAIIAHAAAGDDQDAKLVAVETASKVELPSAAAAIRKLAIGAVSPALRRAALRALGRAGDETSAGLLREYMVGKRGQGPEDAVAAAEALLAMGKRSDVVGTVVGDLSATEDDVRWRALAILSIVAVSKATPKLASLLLARKTSKAEKLAAAAALAVQASLEGVAASKALVSGTKSSDASVRAACAQALAQAAGSGLKSRAAYWSIIKLIKDRDERVRSGATLAAARLEPRRFAKEIYLLGREKSPIVLAALAAGLGKAPGKQALDRLLGLAKSKSALVRRMVARSLLLRPEKAARDMVVAMSRDEDVFVRLFALDAFETSEELDVFIQDEDSRIRQAALSRLVRSKGKSAVVGELAARFAAAPSGSAQRARLARAWLAP